MRDGPTTAVRATPLSAVRTDDARYRLTRGLPDDALRESIRRVGCMTPPICHEVAGDLVPVAGFKRLQVLDELNGPEGHIEVRLLAPGSDHLTVLGVAALEVRRDRAVSPFEAARAVRNGLTLGCARAEIAERLLPSLGLEPHEVVVRRHLKLERVPARLAALLEEKEVSLKRALAFTGLTTEAADTVVALAERLNLSARALEEWADLIGDVARRDECTWGEVVERPAVASAVGNRDLPLSERVRRGRTALWGVRYPAWQAARQRAARHVDALELPDRVRLRWDERFEQEGFHLELDVRTEEQLREDLEALLTETRMRGFRELLDSL